MNALIKTVFFCVLLSPLSSFAEAVKVDWKEDGDKLAFVDTQTGVEWLNLGETKGYTVTNFHDDFPEWRLPTESEINAMFLNIFDIVDLGPSSTYQYVGPEFQTFWQELFGLTANNRSYAFYLGDTGTLHKGGQSGSTLYTDHESQNYYLTTGYAPVGVFLVRDSDYTPSDVPAPLFLTSILLPLLLLGKRKNNSPT